MVGMAVVVAGVVMRVATVEIGAGAMTGGMGAGNPNGGRKGTIGKVGSGVFQSVCRKDGGGRWRAAGGRCSPTGGGGTANIPGGKYNLGATPVGAGMAGGSGTRLGRRRLLMPRRAGI